MNNKSSSKAKNILIVDDDPDILDSLQLILESEGYAITTSEKGDYVEKLSIQNKHLPDLIILDVLLSGKDGRTITRKLKNEKKTHNIPIVMISAHPNAEKSVKESGADDFLSKPFDINNLLSKVRKHIIN